MLKRAIDVVLSTLVLIGLIPLFILIAIAIKVESEGPILFRSVRVGRRHKRFVLYKFRTMVVDAEKISKVVSTPSDDPRITRVGRILRRFNLDELAQFINVLRGEMSIVGPRPEVPQYVVLFTEEEERVILSVRPGITDWATLWIRDKGELLAGSEDPERVYLEKIRPEKLRLQLEYVEKGSLWIDFQIMLKTLKTHLFDRFKSDVRKAHDSRPIISER